jgi:hypothetical protein
VAYLRKIHIDGQNQNGRAGLQGSRAARHGGRLFTFTRLAPSQWKSARTTNAIERLNEEFHRRVKTQTVLPCAETVPMLLWALMASGQIHPPGRLRRNRLPGDGCARSMAGKP